MRTIFIPVAKVFGLLQLYHGLAYISGILPFIHMLTATGDRAADLSIASGGYLPFTIAGILGTLVLTFGAAWLLLCRANWLADRLKIPEAQETGPVSQETLLFTGITLVGIHIAVRAAPTLVSGCIQAADFGLWAVSAIVRPALELVLGLFLFLRARLIMRLLARAEAVAGKRLILGTIIVVVAVIVVGRGIARHPWLKPKLPPYASGLPASLDYNDPTVDAPLPPTSSTWQSLPEAPRAITNGALQVGDENRGKPQPD